MAVCKEIVGCDFITVFGRLKLPQQQQQQKSFAPVAREERAYEYCFGKWITIYETHSYSAAFFAALLMNFIANGRYAGCQLFALAHSGN